MAAKPYTDQDMQELRKFVEGDDVWPLTEGQFAALRDCAFGWPWEGDTEEAWLKGQCSYQRKK